MRLKSVLTAATCAIAFLMLPAILAAQFPGRSGYGGDRRSFDPAEMLRNMDANKNGMIEPSEMASNRAAFFVRGAAQRAGMDLTKPLAIDKLTEAMQRGREERSRDGDRSRDGNRDGDRNRDDRRRDGERRSDRDGSSSASAPGSGSGSPAASNAPAPAAGVVGFGTPAPASGGVTGFGSGALEQRFEPRVISYVEDMLKRYDKNNDGYVDSEEWKSGQWSSSSPPESSDLNKDNRLSKEELSIRIAKRFGSPSPGNSSSAASTGSSATSSSDNSDQVRRYAESLLRQYDKNSDGKLDRDEWSAMPPQHHSADTNSDGTITTEELSAKLASYAGSNSSSSAGSSPGPQAGRIRRFRTPAERLPAGLPSWFMEKDTDQDGQVRMSEFASLWSDATAADFARSDLNGDGIITAKECLKAGGPK